jgi:hypothetical protein
MENTTQKTIDLVSSITHIVSSDNKCQIKFEWLKTQEDKPHLQCFTIQPDTKETFLLKQVSGETEIECLEKVHTFLKDKERTRSMGYSTYKVEWSREGLAGIQKSHFYCRDIQEVVLKFFEGGKTSSLYKIYLIEMMPEA